MYGFFKTNYFYSDDIIYVEDISTSQDSTTGEEVILNSSMFGIVLNFIGLFEYKSYEVQPNTITKFNNLADLINENKITFKFILGASI